MRVYHFINAKFGLEAIRLKRLKLARIADDSCDLPNRVLLPLEKHCFSCDQFFASL